MKYVHSLSSVALVSCLSLNSSVAMSKVIEQVPNSALSAQAEPFVIADLFDTIKKTIQTVDQVNQIRLQEQQRQELEAARKEATEQQRLEAERRRQHFESLSLEDKKAYLAEQEAQKVQADKAAALFILMLMGSGSSSSDVDQPKEEFDPCDYARSRLC